MEGYGGVEAKFTVPGEPVGKGRPRFSTVGKYVKAYTPDKTVSYENLIKLEFESQCRGVFFQKETPLFMGVYAYYAIPKSVSRKKHEMMLSGEIRPLKKADSSNVLKAIEDALNKVAYDDDVQIVDTVIRRWYADIPRVEVEIRSVSHEKESNI